MTDEKIPTNDPTQGMFVKGTIIAVIITIPSLIAFFVSWYILEDLISAAIIGTVVHFIGLISSLKFSKKILSKKS